ncbi:MgtC/SapB family protein [Pelatocladus sp. BLCC-F211]|uniref:MgtC/SapB family protein n=1 Tax=Pelatocladus sp. BLCC-F211 TaxID=3342752 RepID=UPI0035B7C502
MISHFLVSPNTFFLAPNDWANIAFRLCLAVFFGGVIGLERERRRKPAGLRTHMLVSVASAMFVLVILQIDEPRDYNGLSRVIQGIAAGVGFLGAGEILRENSDEQSSRIEVRGLTSAAAIWTSSGLGIIAGCGLWQLGLLSILVSFFILYIMKKYERHI